MIRVKYGLVGNKDFHQLEAAIRRTPMKYAAAKVRNAFFNAVANARHKIATEYGEEVINKFAKRNEDGTLPDDWEIAPGMEEEHKKTHMAFGEREIEIEIAPLKEAVISSVDISDEEYKMLQPFMTLAQRKEKS